MKRDHEKSHKFTPKSLLSPSSIEKLIKGLTIGQIKSRAGLDNIYVEKGTENFEQLQELATMLSNIATNGKLHGDEVLQHIENVETFHKVHFERHLAEGACNNKHSCMCLHCGFFDDKKDPIKCPKDHKSYACHDCQDSFELFSKLRKLFKKVEGQFASTNAYNDNPALKDDVLVWNKQIDQAERNLIDFRAHLAQKVSEANFDQKNVQLEEGECLLVMDYKMKVIPRSYREKMIDWYSKRGISVLGAEVHLMIEDQRKVFYHFLISEDANQDSEAVFCAKHFLYQCILPKYGIKKVRFRCDGGPCFSSNDAKAAMKLWKDLSDAFSTRGEIFCHEIMYKVMVAGCGKTALDGMFGILTMHLVRLVNYGHSYQTAEDLFDLLSLFPLSRSSYHLYKPKRSLLKWPRPNTKTSKLNQLHLLQYCQEVQDAEYHSTKLEGRIHSDLSKPIEYRFHSKEGVQKARATDSEQERDPIDPQNGKFALSTNIYFTSSSSNSTNVIMKNKATQDANDHLLKSTFPFDASFEKLIEDVTACNRETQGCQKRKVEENADRIDRSKVKLEENWKSYQERLCKSGLHPCPKICRKTGNRCTKIYSSSKALDRHISKGIGKCNFPPIDLETNMHLLHQSGKIAFSLATGTMTNRAHAAEVNTFEATEGSSRLHKNAIYCKCGCYNTNRPEHFRASEALKKDLETLFLAGLQTDHVEKSASNKYTPVQALAFLSNLQLENGRRKYSLDPSNPNGPLPTLKYIKSWFGRRARKQIQTDNIDDDCGYQSTSQKKLKDLVKARFPMLRLTQKHLIMKMLALHFELTGVDEGEASNLDKKTTSELKQICQVLKLPCEGRPLLVQLLEMEDKLRELMMVNNNYVEAESNYDDDNGEEEEEETHGCIVIPAYEGTRIHDDMNTIISRTMTEQENLISDGANDN